MYVGETDRWRVLIEYLDLDGDERVLDVGTALGEFPRTLAANESFHGQITGIDWSPTMIAQASERSTTTLIDFRVVDLNNGLPFPDETFDLITCIGVLETLPNPDYALAELSRVLKKGKWLVVSAYHGWGQKDRIVKWYGNKLDAHGFAKPITIPFRQGQDLLLIRKRD